jgi:hypothetical protein
MAWRFVEEEVADDWPLFTDASTHRLPHAPSRVPPRLYETILTLALLYGVAVFLLWQRLERRIDQLEQEAAALRTTLATPPPNNATSDDGRDAASAGVARGPERASYQFETPHLRFAANAKVAALIQEVAMTVDTQYAQLHRDLGLALPLSADKLTIVIAPILDEPTHPKNSVLVPAPAAVAELYDIAPVDALAHELLSRLAQHLLNRALRNRAIKPQWQPMVRALRVHLQREYRLNPHGQSHLAYLYRRHFAQTKSLDLAQAAGTTYRVQPLDATAQAEIALWSQHPPTADEIADPLVEFMVERYGYARIPALLDAFTEHQTWEALIPAVFAMSSARFEQEWHRYLQEHYPITEP